MMPRFHPQTPIAAAARRLVALAWAALALAVLPVPAQPLLRAPPASAAVAATAPAGVALAELSANAPIRYTVRRGDTLWRIAGLYLRKPWRWPDLWDQNRAEVRNPHRIYPGQTLLLETNQGLARLRSAPEEILKISPRTRTESLTEAALPALQTHLIEPFLVEPLIVAEDDLLKAPRIVATQEGRVLLSRGDRAYIRSDGEEPLSTARGKPLEWRVFRNAVPLKDPQTGDVLAHEAQYLGRALLVHGETESEVAAGIGLTRVTPVPATIDIIASKEEMRVGDRLLPEPPRELLSYVPHAPAQRIEGSIVSVYGSAVANAAQNQVVTINRGTQDGIERGHVLALQKAGARLLDKTDPDRTTIQLPDERNGLLMVFRPFERVSYALILEIVDGVKVGDRVTNPR